MKKWISFIGAPQLRSPEKSRSANFRVVSILYVSSTMKITTVNGIREMCTKKHNPSVSGTSVKHSSSAQIGSRKKTLQYPNNYGFVRGNQLAYITYRSGNSSSNFRCSADNGLIRFAGTP